MNATALSDAAPNSVGEDEMQHSLSSQIGLLLRFAQAAVWGDLLDTFKPFGFRPQHYAALKIVDSKPGCKQQDLGGALGISRSNLVMLIDELVEQKLIERRQNLEDRRSNALHLSARGRALLPELDRGQQAHEGRLASLLEEGEQEILVALLRKLGKLRKLDVT
ncbi:MarR family winged helix-turn-helix transcriptional regulator [Sphingobium lactosutens]|nr:MarR family transcriptional regulator [Sphingobium lactosutens]